MNTGKELLDVIAFVGSSCLSMDLKNNKPSEEELENALGYIQSKIPNDKHQDLQRRAGDGGGPISRRYKEVIEWLDLILKTTPLHLQHSILGLKGLIDVLLCVFFHYDELERMESAGQTEPEPEPEPA